MALKVKSTPKLNKEESIKFLRRVESKQSVASYPIGTPKLTRFIKKLVNNAAQVQQDAH
jgi:hypothetical protein